jgi:hypothetical protein
LGLDERIWGTLSKIITFSQFQCTTFNTFWKSTVQPLSRGIQASLVLLINFCFHYPGIVTVPFTPLHFMLASVERLTLSQVHVMVITETTGNCTLEASPLLQINNTTSTVHKLFIRLEAKCYKFLRKQAVIWPFNIIKLYRFKWSTDELLETGEGQTKYVWLWLFPNAEFFEDSYLAGVSSCRHHIQLIKEALPNCVNVIYYNPGRFPHPGPE